MHMHLAPPPCCAQVWDAASGACCRILQAHSHHAMCCAWSSGGNLLVSRPDSAAANLCFVCGKLGTAWEWQRAPGGRCIVAQCTLSTPLGL